ncbi:hypothetical protein N0V82_004899 [Gnomoniopsis sp. IMI 355080]|nr:hypothetical protein N0V82_004899 [Gnomoniopsis sp. IMI 355080]
MSLLENIKLDHVPASHSVHVAFFKNVSNAGFLQSQLLARNADFEYAFIDASAIASRLHVLAAVFKALSCLVDGKLRSPNVHAETVNALSASNNISEAYRRYGISADVRDVIVVKILFPTDERPQPPNAQDIWEHLSANVKGTAVPFTDEEIATSTDWDKIKKYYKLKIPVLASIKDEQTKLRESEMLILGAMALRGV